jgi:ribosome-associated protein
VGQALSPDETVGVPQPATRREDRGLKVPGGPYIPAGELRFRASGSGGPGGQHANTANTRVEVVFDVAGSKALAGEEKARLVEVLGPVVRVVASDERSQWRNRRLALERLGIRLADALQIPEERRPTAPPRNALARRRSQRERGQEKRRRRRWTYEPGE